MLFFKTQLEKKQLLAVIPTSLCFHWCWVIFTWSEVMISLKNQEGLTIEHCAFCWATAYLLVFNSFSILLQWLYFLIIYMCFVLILNWPVFNFLFFFPIIHWLKRKNKVKWFCLWVVLVLLTCSSESNCLLIKDVMLFEYFK